TAVLFGLTPSPSFTVQSDTIIMAVPPTPASGTVDVRVVTPLGTSALASIDRFTYLNPPTITGINPSTGSVCGGTTVILTGSGLSNVYGIDIKGSPVQSFTVNSDSQITAVTSVPGTIMGVTNDVGLSLYLTSTALPPEYANTNLTAFDGSFALSATAGADYPGTPQYGVSASAVTPRITGMTPNQGPTIGAPNQPGQLFTNPAIRIIGCGFSGATAVLFGSTPSQSFTVQSDTILMAVPPTPASGSVDVRVVTSLGTSPLVLLDKFKYVAPPTITGISPSTGSICGGTTVVVTGSGLSNVYAINIKGSPVQSFTINSDSQITAIASVPGTIVNDLADVEVSAYLTSTALPPEYANTNLTAADGVFAVGASAGSDYPGTPTYGVSVQPVIPRITGMTPNQGPTIGAPNHPSQLFTNPAIRIIGCGFSGATAVLFGLTPSPSFTVQSDTIIMAVPPTPASGTVDVRVVTPLGISSIIP
ncbi:MAG TPA: IPT/TIG domain-containing protein, partial [Methylomirabilota bacterium]|nr:IPT/TIG domain-containing protein [Methylomirabilota bacterium]